MQESTNELKGIDNIMEKNDRWKIPDYYKRSSSKLVSQKMENRKNFNSKSTSDITLQIKPSNFICKVSKNGNEMKSTGKAHLTTQSPIKNNLQSPRQIILDSSSPSKKDQSKSGQMTFVNYTIQDKNEKKNNFIFHNSDKNGIYSHTASKSLSINTSKSNDVSPKVKMPKFLPLTKNGMQPNQSGAHFKTITEQGYVSTAGLANNLRSKTSDLKIKKESSQNQEYQNVFDSLTNTTDQFVANSENESSNQYLKKLLSSTTSLSTSSFQSNNKLFDATANSQGVNNIEFDNVSASYSADEDCSIKVAKITALYDDPTSSSTFDDIMSSDTPLSATYTPLTTAELDAPMDCYSSSHKKERSTSGSPSQYNPLSGSVSHSQLHSMDTNFSLKSQKRAFSNRYSNIRTNSPIRPRYRARTASGNTILKKLPSSNSLADLSELNHKSFLDSDDPIFQPSHPVKTQDANAVFTNNVDLSHSISYNATTPTSSTKRRFSNNGPSTVSVASRSAASSISAADYNNFLGPLNYQNNSPFQEARSYIDDATFYDGLDDNSIVENMSALKVELSLNQDFVSEQFEQSNKFVIKSNENDVVRDSMIAIDNTKDFFNGTYSSHDVSNFNLQGFSRSNKKFIPNNEARADNFEVSSTNLFDKNFAESYKQAVSDQVTATNFGHLKKTKSFQLFDGKLNTDLKFHNDNKGSQNKKILSIGKAGLQSHFTNNENELTPALSSSSSPSAFQSSITHNKLTNSNSKNIENIHNSSFNNKKNHNFSDNSQMQYATDVFFDDL